MGPDLRLNFKWKPDACCSPLRSHFLKGYGVESCDLTSGIDAPIDRQVVLLWIQNGRMKRTFPVANVHAILTRHGLCDPDEVLFLDSLGQQVGQFTAQIDPGLVVQLPWDLHPLGHVDLMGNSSVGVDQGRVFDGILPVPYLGGDPTVPRTI